MKTICCKKAHVNLKLLVLKKIQVKQLGASAKNTNFAKGLILLGFKAEALLGIYTQRLFHYHCN